MARQRDALGLLAGVVLAYALVALAWWGYGFFRRQVRLDTVEPSYYHYEFVEPRLRTWDPELRRRWKERPPRVLVLRDGVPVETIAGLREATLRWDPDRSAFIGRWPCPWNAPTGHYGLSLQEEPGLADRLRVSPFEIRRRVPRRLPRRFVALSFENIDAMRTMKVTAPDGSRKDWRGLLDWVRFMEADAFWVLLGQTPGDRPGDIWVSRNLEMIPELAEECRRRGIGLGLYVENYLTMSKARLPRYEYALDIKDGHVQVTRAISLRDPRRPEDVAALVNRFQGLAGVQYVGLDYIRNALGGYELVDDFYAEMPGVHPPSEWPALSREERMVWFVRKKIMRKDHAFIDAWQWWRAHRVALIVRRIRREIGTSKLLWAFTLTWDKGWQHGQDPVMMNDAGVDADALMLYEANAEQFAAILKDFHRYLRRDDVQLLPGDIIDWPLHQRSPLGPPELRRRLEAALDSIYQDGPADAFFVHDLARALWGRLGPYSTRDWMVEAKKTARALRSPRPR